MLKSLNYFPLSSVSYAAHIQLIRASVVALGLNLIVGAAMAQADSIPGKDKAQPSVETVQAVIVTGTRLSGLKAIDSASPIQVLDTGALERAGQADVIQALAQNIPSFTAQAFGSDTANLTLSARLRGLSPTNTLVLVNGKRRHTTANLAVLGGPYQGAAAADLNFISLAAIDHIEVLQDGAAAQYGTDAIAGVINVILKNDAHGGAFSSTAGQYFDGGGRTGQIALNFGLPLGDKSFLNVSAETRYHGRSDRGGIDPRVIDPARLAAMPILTTVPGYPYLNHISGDAAYHLSQIGYNASFRVNSGAALYSFVSYGQKQPDAFENYGLPNRLPVIYPLGFSPRETLNENDLSFTAGLKGKLETDWNWDVSSTYGKDANQIGVVNSGNVSLFRDTGTTPTVFHAGAFTSSQWTNNLDLNGEAKVGWKTPLSLAVGLEHRIDTYEIGVGDVASRYKEGSQSYPGFLLTDAGHYRRNNVAVYLDLAGSPIDKLKLDAAIRWERFSDFGRSLVGKLTERYDVSPTFSLRSTVSSGFRAPTMAEQFYSSTNVAPRTAFVQLVPNSAGAALIGVNGLKPEKSENISIGVVLHPSPKMAITLDAYQINIRDRIVGSGLVYGSGGAVNSAAVVAAIRLNGNVLDSSVSETGISIFSNAVDTRSRGLEIVYSNYSNIAEMGRVDWSAAANYNQVKLIKVNQAPLQLRPQTLLDQTAISDLETASPSFRLNLGALWKFDQWTVNLRESVFGPSSEFGTLDGGEYFKTTIATRAITDLDISYRLSKSFTLTVGANNVFNQYPNKTNAELLRIQRADLDNRAVVVYPVFSPFGINGGYYYARLNYNF